MVARFEAVIIFLLGVNKQSLNPIVILFSSLSVVVSLIVLLGYVIRSESLVSLLPILPPMRLLAAVGFLILGISVVLDNYPRLQKIIGAVFLILFLGVMLKPGQLGLPLATTCLFVLLSIGLVFSSAKIKYYLSVAGMMISLMFFCGFIFDENEFVLSIQKTGMALHTALCFLFLFAAVFFQSAFLSDRQLNSWHILIYVFRNYSVRKKFGLMLMTLIGGLMVFGLALYERYTINDRVWKSLDASLIPKSTLLRGMKELFGYGGGTFYFKNLILRGGEEYGLLTQSAFKDLIQKTNDYFALKNLTRKEYKALEDIQETAADYMYHVDVVKKLIKSKKTPKQIDSMIWIEDDRALLAFDMLDDEYRIQERSAMENIHNSRSLMVLVAALGFLFSVMVIVVFGVLINKTLLSTLSMATQIAQDIVAEKYSTKITVDSNDELGLLAGSLTKMRDHLVQFREAILKKTDDISRANNFLNSIFENLPTTVFLKDAKSRKYTHFNRAGEELFGLDREYILGKTDFEILNQSRAENTLKTDDEVMSTKKLVEVPDENVELRTGVKILNTKKIPILTTDGTPTHILGISEDVTERRKLERSLKESQERLRLALKASHIASWDWKISGDSFTGDDYFYSLMGIDKRNSKISLANFSEYIHPQERSSITMGILDTIRADKDLDLKFRVVRPLDKRERVFSWKGKIYKDHAGKPDLMAGIVTDVTEKPSRDGGFVLTEERFQGLYGHDLVGVVYMDANGQINSANDAFLRMTGYGRKELLSLNWFNNVTSSDFLVTEKSKIEGLISKGWADPYEKEIVRKDKTKLNVQVAGTRVDAKGAGIIYFVRNLAREMEIEKQTSIANKLD